MAWNCWLSLDMKRMFNSSILPNQFVVFPEFSEAFCEDLGFHLFTIETRNISIYETEKLIREIPLEHTWTAWYQVNYAGALNFDVRYHFAMKSETDAITMKFKIQ